MIIKKREVLFSAIIVFVMLLVGLFVSDAILQGAISKSEDYRTATIIENEDQFLYGMQTNFGHSLVYGEVSSNSFVTYDEIGNGFIYIEKHKEHYTRHTRTVTRTDSNGKKHTEREELEDLMLEREDGYYCVPEECCPICQFIEYSNCDLARFLEREYKVSRSEYVTEVCSRFNLNPAEIVSGLKDRFGTYRHFRDYINSR